MPPVHNMSGIRYSANLSFRIGTKSHRVYSLSPTHSGTPTESFTCLSASLLLGWTGSSNQPMLKGSRRRAIAIAVGTSKLPWQSIKISISGPTSCRIAAMVSTARDAPSGDIVPCL